MAHNADIGSSAHTAMAMASSCGPPGAAVVTSNHASTTRTAAVAAAARQARVSRRWSSIPVVSRPRASSASSPAHAVSQWAAWALGGNQATRTHSHGIVASPDTSRPRLTAWRPCPFTAGRLDRRDGS